MNLYQILGIKQNANKKTIKKAYRELSKIHHPDKGGDIEKFNMITKAYKVLIDDKKKKRYDNGENVDNILKSQNKNNEQIKIISEIFVKIMNSNINPETTNIIEEIDKSIDLNIENSSKEILKLIGDIQRYKTFLKKLKSKNKKNTLMKDLAKDQIENRKEVLKIFKNRVLDLEKAKKLLKDYDYDIIEKIEMQIIRNFSNTTSTWI